MPVQRITSLLFRLLTTNSEIKQYGKGIFVDEVADLEELLQPLAAARRALEQRAARLNDKRHDKTGKKVDEISRETMIIRQNQHQHQHQLTTSLGSLDHNTERIYHQTGHIESQVETVLYTQRAFVNVVSEQNAHVNRIHEENTLLKQRVMQLEMLNSFHMLAEEKRRNQRFYEEGELETPLTNQDSQLTPFEAPGHNLQYLEGPDPQASSPALIFNLDQLLTVLCNDVETRSHAKNLYSVLEQYHIFSDKALAQAAYLSEISEFRHWLLARDSYSLLVDGHCSENMSQGTSPLSVFCATLVQSLLDIPPCLADMVLYFFCGQHIDDNGPLPGPQGLLRSLTAQIILGLESRHIIPSLNFLRDLPGLASNYRPKDIDIRTVGRVFSGLISQLPPGTTVHCIIEDISAFETALDGWAEALSTVIDCLQWRVSNTRSPVFLKPLYTSAEASTVIYGQLARNQRIDLRSGHYYGSVSTPRGLIMDLTNQLSSSMSATEE